MEYCKINTIFKRDSKNHIIPTEYTLAEFKVLENIKWECSEKINGTNMRVELFVTKPLYDDVGEMLQEPQFIMEFKGRTDKADIPKHLLKKMHELFDDVDWHQIFPDAEPFDRITIYGEGYEMKIQKEDNYIKDGVNFILFDVKYDKWWLTRQACEEIAKELNLDIVPFMGHKTIPEAIEMVKNGFISNISENREYIAEGLVLKAPCGLLKRDGERLITKIKYKDFQAL